MTGRIVVYTILGCPFCTAAKKRLKAEGFDYMEVRVDRSPPNIRQWLIKTTGRTSVPQIFFNSTHVGGNDDLVAMLSSPGGKEKLAAILSDTEEDPTFPLLPHPAEMSEKKPTGAAVSEAAATIPDEEKDGAADIIQSGIRAGVFGPNRKGIFCGTIANSVTGEKLVEWLSSWEDFKTREDAVQFADQLMKKKFLTSCDQHAEFIPDGSLYRLGFAGEDALNADKLCFYKVDNPEEVAQSLRNLTLELFTQFLSEDGRFVDYKGMESSDLWSKLKEATVRLQRLDLSVLSVKARIAFFINIYNVLVIHGFVTKGAPTNHLQRFRFFSKTAYIIGGMRLSLNEIENAILRANRGSMATLYMTPWKEDDPRYWLVLPAPEPRIHFALNCGARSCPPIKTFSGENLDEELDLATRSFLEGDDGLQLFVDRNEVRFSQLLQWYQVDFGDDQPAVLNWILGYLEGDKKDEFAALIAGDEDDDGGKVKVSYHKYDWGHNAKD